MCLVIVSALKHSCALQTLCALPPNDLVMAKAMKKATKKGGHKEVKKTIINKKELKGVKKKPAASQSGNPGDAAGWESFQIVPFADKSLATKGDQDFGHLNIKTELTKPPAVVKHIQAGSLNTIAGCQSVKDFLRSLEKKR